MPRQCSPNYNHITSDHTHLSEGDRAEDVDGRKKKEQREKKLVGAIEQLGRKIMKLEVALKYAKQIKRCKLSS